MARRKKRLSKWGDNPPTHVPVEEVEAVLNHYFPDGYEYRGSHIVVRHPELAKYPLAYGPDGHITIPVKKGQQVKGRYLKTLAQTISFLEELGQFE